MVKFIVGVYLILGGAVPVEQNVFTYTAQEWKTVEACQAWFKSEDGQKSYEQLKGFVKDNLPGQKFILVPECQAPDKDGKYHTPAAPKQEKK